MNHIRSKVVAIALACAAPAIANPQGTFSPPFEEAQGHPKCAPGGPCKPAAGSVAILHDGRILYWNALEGTEAVEFSIIGEIDDILNDQSRILDLSVLGSPSSPNPAAWSQPAPVDGGANPDGNDSEALLDGTPLEGALDTSDDFTRNDGALFCSALIQLADGRILAAGGTDYYSEPGTRSHLPIYGIAELEGLKNARIFDPETDTWTQTGSMSYGRWYPSLVTLPHGDVFVAGGVTKLVKPVYPERPVNSGRNVVQTETYDPDTGEWSENGPTAERSLPLFPRLHLLPNGHVYYNAVGQSFNPGGEAYDQALWNIVAAYDPDTKAWTDLGIAGLPLRMNDAGLGALATVLNPTNPDAAMAGLERLQDERIEDPDDLTFLLDDPDVNRTPPLQLLGAGFRGSTFSTMLPLRPDVNGAYRKAELLVAGGVVGGVTAGTPGGYVGTPLSRIDTVTVRDDGSLAHEARQTGALQQHRWYPTAVLLPDDSVMIFSGADRDEVVGPGAGIPVRRSERFDPITENWSIMALQNRARTYHNTAALLPDGRVLVGGHAPINTAYLFHFSIPGLSPNDGRDPSFEIYSPPYTFRTRPEIRGAPVTLQRGEIVAVTTDVDAEDVDSVVLIRNTSITHLVDGDQRAVVVPIESRQGSDVEIAIPSEAAVLPAGPYVLFLRTKETNGALTPSEGHQVMVTS